tara:strand:+ start:1040 stop:1342 length:303 start_codon:yes stop_codon:yes gene_type:complete
MAIKKQVNLTVADTALGFTVPSGISPTKAVFSLETAAIRIQTDGTAATATNGTRLIHDNIYVVKGREAIANTSMIRDTSTSGVINIMFFDDSNGLEQLGA